VVSKRKVAKRKSGKKVAKTKKSFEVVWVDDRPRGDRAHADPQQLNARGRTARAVAGFCDGPAARRLQSPP